MLTYFLPSVAIKKPVLKPSGYTNALTILVGISVLRIDPGVIFSKQVVGKTGMFKKIII
jgi:hypothetical protein